MLSENDDLKQDIHEFAVEGPAKLKRAPKQKAPNPFSLGRASLKIMQGVEALEASVAVPKNVILVQSVGMLRECANACRDAGVFSLDTETAASHPTVKKPATKWWLPDFRVTALGIYADDKAFIIPNEMIRMDVNFNKGQIQDELGDVLEDPTLEKVFHNAKFDIHAVRRSFDIDMNNTLTLRDDMLAAWLLEENQRHGLEDLCAEYLGTERWKIKQDGNFHVWPVKMAQIYLGGDVENTMKLYEFQKDFLVGNPQYAKLGHLYEKVEIPHMQVLVEMERNGIGWDQDYFENVARPEVEEKVASALRKAKEYMGDINLNSPLQVAAVLFDGLKLSPMKDRGRSVDKRVLANLKGQHPAVDALEEYRKYSTIKKLFTDELPTFAVNGRIHPSLQPIGATSGRLSCSSPNLQQLPKRSVGPLIRKCFVPSPGHVFVAMDYSQIELRILAHLANDENMIAAFGTGVDFHTLTAHNMFGIPIADLDADKDRPERVSAKTINFGIPYGCGASKLADMINMQLHEIGIVDKDLSKAESQSHINAYERAYPGVAAYIKSQKILAHKQGFVETILGRKRRLYDEINSSDRGLMSLAERQSVNSPIQGSSADMIKVAAVKIYAMIVANHWPYRPIMSIHDELLLEVPKDWLQHHRDTVDQMAEIMQNAIPLIVPIKVSVDILDRWGSKVSKEDMEIDEEAV